MTCLSVIFHKNHFIPNWWRCKHSLIESILYIEKKLHKQAMPKTPLTVSDVNSEVYGDIKYH